MVNLSQTCARMKPGFDILFTVHQLGKLSRGLRVNTLMRNVNSRRPLRKRKLHPLIHTGLDFNLAQSVVDSSK